MRSSTQSLAWEGSTVASGSSPPITQVRILYPRIQRTLRTRKGRRDEKWAAGCKAKGNVGKEAHSPQNHHVEGVVGDTGDEGHEGDEEDRWEQEVGTGDGARPCLG